MNLKDSENLVNRSSGSDDEPIVLKTWWWWNRNKKPDDIGSLQRTTDRSNGGIESTTVQMNHHDHDVMKTAEHQIQVDFQSSDSLVTAISALATASQNITINEHVGSRLQFYNQRTFNESKPRNGSNSANAVFGSPICFGLCFTGRVNNITKRNQVYREGYIGKDGRIYGFYTIFYHLDK